jgi:hypothetical protein
MCKNDEAALIENIKYHTLIGVDHFIIYDNLSTRPLSQALSNMSNVTVHLWSDTQRGRQVRCYNDCINRYANTFRWVGFIDTDEFIVPKNGVKSVKDFLKDYENYGGLGINWRCFGSSGHTKKQTSIIESYIYAAGSGDDAHIKSIVNPKAVETSVINLHGFKYKPGFFCVNELKQKIETHHHNTPVSRKLIQINHYVTRSREEYEEKRKRGDGNVIGGAKLTEQFWSRFQGGQIDTSIKDLIKLIKG